MNRLCLLTTAALAAVVAAQPTPPNRLALDLFRMPDTVNAMAVIHMDAVLQSPRARTENWAKRNQAEILGGAIPVNPAIERIVVGSHFDPNSNQLPWSLALVTLARNAELTLAQIAAARGGVVEEIAGQQVAATSRGYFAEVQPRLIAGANGLSHGDFSKYLKFAKTNTLRVLSQYLVDSVRDVRQTPVFLVFDTADLMEPTVVARHVAASKALASDKAGADVIAKFLSGLRGVRIAIEIGESAMKATVTLDAAGPFTGNPTALRSFLLETLDHAGAHLDVISQAVPMPAATGQAYVTDLSEGGLLRLMTLLHVPPAPEAPPPAQRSPEIAREARVAATRRYFNAVSNMLNELNASYRRATNYNSTANWHEGFARRIDQLSTVDVDQTVLAWGAAAAYDLRALAASLRGIPIQLQKLDGQTRVWMSGLGNAGWGWGGGRFGAPMVYLDTNVGQVRQEQTKAIEAGRANRDQVWTQLQSEREQVRQKFQDQFGVDLGR